MEQHFNISPELSAIIQKSIELTRNLGGHETGTGHLLAGMLGTPSKARDVLNTLHIFEAEILEHMSKSQQPIEATPTQEDERVSMTLSLEATRVLKLAYLEARLTRSANPEPEHLLLAMLRDGDNKAKRLLSSHGINYRMIAESLNIRKNGIQGNFGFDTDSEEEEFPTADGSSNTSERTAQTMGANEGGGNTPVIDKFGTDLTRAATEGKLDPVVGRETEIQRMAQILCRRKKNNPIIIGEPGVGKSALVEGLAELIAQRRVVHTLQDKRVVMLDMATLVAGTQYRGQFEERLRRLLIELKNHPEIILFIDEIHTIIGAGGAQGSLDAANILKPALARGEIQCIGATTISEFKKSIEKDGALDRRFQKILLEPTTAEETLSILQQVKDRYERHHGVSYTDEALAACVHLTERYVSDRSLPDKAIDALDEAGSRKKLQNVTVPPEISELEKQIEECRHRKMEAAAAQNYELAANLRDDTLRLTAELKEKEREWQNAIGSQHIKIDENDIAEVVSMMSGVPVSQMTEAESVRLKSLASDLKRTIIAQDAAIDKIARSITRSRLGLKDPNRPIGTFMFVGPTGVGKTYLVQQLAEKLFGSKDALIRVDMSEYGEKFSTSRLVGAPPGYVGYEEGGQLTERVRRHPHSIILLDEIEKAHPDVFNTLLQVMDEGRMTDGNGTTVDFRNTIIIMTSNSGTRQLREYGQGIGFSRPDNNGSDMAESIVRKALQKQFAPEFLNRVDDIVMFRPLNSDDAIKIAELELDKLKQRMLNSNYELTFTPSAIDFIVKKGFDSIYGARSMKRAIQTYVEDALADRLLDTEVEGPCSFCFDAAKDAEHLSITRSQLE